LAFGADVKQIAREYRQERAERNHKQRRDDHHEQAAAHFDLAAS